MAVRLPGVRFYLSEFGRYRVSDFWPCFVGYTCWLVCTIGGVTPRLPESLPECYS